MSSPNEPRSQIKLFSPINSYPSSQLIVIVVPFVTGNSGVTVPFSIVIFWHTARKMLALKLFETMYRRGITIDIR